jgi:Domain of unknown function (DUF397)
VNTPHRWRKSSHSNEDGACIELAHTHDTLRDSKNPNGPTLTGDVHRLLTAIKTEQL